MDKLYLFLNLKEEPANDVMTLEEYINKVEKEYIKKIIALCKGNKTRAADMLGISRKSLWEKLKA